MDGRKGGWVVWRIVGRDEGGKEKEGGMSWSTIKDPSSTNPPSFCHCAWGISSCVGIVPAFQASVFHRTSEMQFCGVWVVAQGDHVAEPNDPAGMHREVHRFHAVTFPEHNKTNNSQIIQLQGGQLVCSAILKCIPSSGTSLPSLYPTGRPLTWDPVCRELPTVEITNSRNHKHTNLKVSVLNLYSDIKEQSTGNRE